MLTIRGLSAVVLVGTDDFVCEAERGLTSVDLLIRDLRERRLL